MNKYHHQVNTPTSTGLNSPALSRLSSTKSDMPTRRDERYDQDKPSAPSTSNTPVLSEKSNYTSPEKKAYTLQRSVEHSSHDSPSPVSQSITSPSSSQVYVCINI